MFKKIRAFFRRLTCLHSGEDRVYLFDDASGWTRSDCRACGQAWLHFRDLAIPFVPRDEKKP